MDNANNFHITLTDRIFNMDYIGKYDKSDPVFHYTSPSSLISILKPEGPVLWFSRYDTLNDKTEGLHILDVYHEVCDCLLREERISPSSYSSVRNLEMPEEDFFLYSNTSDNMTCIRKEKFNQYICCFSKNNDSLPMWNYYTKEGNYEGYNIGFSFFNTQYEGVQNDLETNCHFRLYNVIYDDKEKEQILTNELIWAYLQSRRFSDNVNEIRHYLVDFLKTLMLVFKSNYFRHEAEVRAIFSIPQSNRNYQVQYRDKNGYIIPYIELGFSKKNVTAITIGPLLNDSSAKNSVNNMMRDLNYPVFDIATSKVPIRY